MHTENIQPDGLYQRFAVGEEPTSGWVQVSGWVSRTTVVWAWFRKAETGEGVQAAGGTEAVPEDGPPPAALPTRFRQDSDSFSTR